MPDEDLYAQFGANSKDYFIDPDTNTIKRKPDLALPTELPVDPFTGNPMYADTAQASVAPQVLKKLTGTGGEERYQTWPERMIRSGLALPADVYSGREPIVDESGHTAQPVIERAQDTAGLAGMSTLGIKPGTASVGSGMVRNEKPTTFYRGTNLGDERRIRTGNDTWDGNLFVSSNEDAAKMYGNNIQKYEAKPEAKILYEGTKEFVNTAGKWRKDESMLDFASRASEAAKAAGYDAVHFKRQGDIGTPIFNPDKFTLLEDSKAATAIGALNQSGMYSNLERTIANSKVQKATPEQWQSYLKNQPGVKPEELEFSLQGLGNGPISKDQLLAHAQENGIKLGEVWKGKNLDDSLNKTANDIYGSNYNNLNEIQRSIVDREASNSGALDKVDTKYSSYQLPGGVPDSYRELLMTLPRKDVTTGDISQKLFGKEMKYLDEGQREQVVDHLRTIHENVAKGSQDYKSSHWDEPNVLAHIRMNDRDIPGVGKTLHVEEVQSDWHQEGRKNGYKNEANAIKAKAIMDERAQIEKDLGWAEAIKNERYNQLDKELNKYENNPNGVPNAPFKKTWDELALKRVLSEAVKHDYQAVSWTPGEAQAARYDLSKQLNSLRYYPETKKLVGEDKSGKTTFRQENIEPDKLADYVGKDVAQKLLEKELNGKYQELSGLDLKVGGEGMKAFYDTMLPAKANALIKKMGGKVEYKDFGQIQPIKNYELRKSRERNKYLVYDHDLDIYLENNRLFSKEEANNIINSQKDKTVMPIIKITPQMREQIQSKGFPLYSSGVPTFTPVDKSPFEDQKKYKLIPVEGNPFQ